MHIHVVETLRLGKIDKRLAVIDMRVNTAVTHQAHDVQLAVVLLDVLHCAEKCRVCKEIAVRDTLGDTSKFLINNATCAHIEMADFAVAHLTFGQTYRQTACVKRCCRIVGHQVMHIRTALHAYCVSLCLLGQTIAVHDDKSCNFFVHKNLFVVDSAN